MRNKIQTILRIKELPFYIRDFFKILKQKNGDKTFPFGELYPILTERHSSAGTMSGQYFHQDYFVAKKVFADNPQRHIDIGSRIDGFVAHVAVFRKIEIVDIRPIISTVENIVFTKFDLMELPHDYIDSYDSVSSLHAIEHFGLGRYDDPIDYYGHVKALDNIYKILKVGGKFYFSVPMGDQRIEFNAHRVFSLGYLLGLFENKYKVASFSYVNDAGEFFENVVLEDEKITNNYGCHNGCGILELVKI